MIRVEVKLTTVEEETVLRHVRAVHGGGAGSPEVASFVQSLVRVGIENLARKYRAKDRRAVAR